MSERESKTGLLNEAAKTIRGLMAKQLAREDQLKATIDEIVSKVGSAAACRILTENRLAAGLRYVTGNEFTMGYSDENEEVGEDRDFKIVVRVEGPPVTYRYADDVLFLAWILDDEVGDLVTLRPHATIKTGEARGKVHYRHRVEISHESVFAVFDLTADSHGPERRVETKEESFTLNIRVPAASGISLEDVDDVAAYVLNELANDGFDKWQPDGKGGWQVTVNVAPCNADGVEGWHVSADLTIVRKTRPKKQKTGRRSKA